MGISVRTSVLGTHRNPMCTHSCASWYSVRRLFIWNPTWKVKTRLEVRTMTGINYTIKNNRSLWKIKNVNYSYEAFDWSNTHYNEHETKFNIVKNVSADSTQCVSMSARSYRILYSVAWKCSHISRFFCSQHFSRRVILFYFISSQMCAIHHLRVTTYYL